ncbi:hypothetical protein FisN_17Hh257 [Fistulifera solaris]|uniref:Uncharacterized protein n=1 Tax=Fistulifera solaris TaxID=1519565 RepID=A0A1Z5JHA8_FISSO|nr:hypothetical protein FisN_17Hh257 [Fistulifera solaris]|eukprot:GAX13316.1 hypothetical protein FisN_17Hh257 [Fistulifera solaris]
MLSKSTATHFLTAGVSVIAGYSIFVKLFHNQCATFLIDKEHQHNQTIRSLQETHAEAIEQACQEDAVRFLETQTVLTSQNEELQHQLDLNREQLSKVSQQNDAYDERILKLSEQVKRLQRELGSSTVQVRQVQRVAQQEVESLRQQLDLSRSLVQQKIDEVRSLASTDGHDMSDVVRLQAAITRRNAAQCVQWLGVPPYALELTLHDHSSLRVEFTDFADMPHMIWTFLQLVDDGLYDGTSLQYKNTDRGPAVTGGEPHSASKQIHSSLQRQYATAGYGSEPLWFEELSPVAPCRENTFGLVGRGPTLLFPMLGYEDGGRFACPGKIVSGADILQQLRQTGQPIIIESVRILHKDGLKERSARFEL